MYLWARLSRKCGPGAQVEVACCFASPGQGCAQQLLSGLGEEYSVFLKYGCPPPIWSVVALADRPNSFIWNAEPLCGDHN